MNSLLALKRHWYCYFSKKIFEIIFMEKVFHYLLIVLMLSCTMAGKAKFHGYDAFKQ